MFKLIFAVGTWPVWAWCSIPVVVTWRSVPRSPAGPFSTVRGSTCPASPATSRRRAERWVWAVFSYWTYWTWQPTIQSRASWWTWVWRRAAWSMSLWSIWWPGMLTRCSSQWVGPAYWMRSSPSRSRMRAMWSSPWWLWWLWQRSWWVSRFAISVWGQASWMSRVSPWRQTCTSPFSSGRWWSSSLVRMNWGLIRLLRCFV